MLSTSPGFRALEGAALAVAGGAADGCCDALWACTLMHVRPRQTVKMLAMRFFMAIIYRASIKAANRPAVRPSLLRRIFTAPARADKWPYGSAPVAALWREEI